MRKNSPDIPLLISLEGMSRPDVSQPIFHRVYESQFSWFAATDIFLARIFHEFLSRDPAGNWIRGVLEQYVAGSDTRGRPEGRSDTRSQQAIHEISGLGNRGIYKPVLFGLKAQASKDLQKIVQNGTNSLRPIDHSPWQAGNHSVSRKSGRWIYQRALSFSYQALKAHCCLPRDQL
jgi:hypothetical protein